MIERLGSWCFHHRGRVLVGWLLAAVALAALAATVGSDFADAGRLRGTDSDRAYTLLAREFPQAATDTATVVFEAPGGIEAPATKAGIEQYLVEITGSPGVAGVHSPFDDPSHIAPGGTIAYATLDVPLDQNADLADAAPALRARAAALEQSGVRVEFGGGWFEEGGVPSTEALGLLAAAVILLVSFGSILAMGLPILTALVGVVCAAAAVAAWSFVVPTPDFTSQVALMMGIGVGIDYALFVITRYRTALHDAPADRAIREAMGTAGRAVVFAGGTVVVSLLGMLLMGLDFLYGLALGTATAVLIAVAAAVTLLPALLRSVSGRLARANARRDRHGGGTRLWWRWSRTVQRRPWPMAIAGVAVLAALAAPALGMRLATADAGNDPSGSTTRAAYDLLAQGFGPGANGPLLLAVDQPAGADPAALATLRDEVAATPGVAAVTEPAESPSGRAAVLTVVPTTSPQDPATEHLVRHLRADVLPAATSGTGLQAHVGGATASNVDFASKISERLPLFIGAVLVLSFLLLALTFRSLLVPLKAVALNLLSIGAAYGVLVMVFQWGWGGSVLGVTGGAPIEPWAPMMLFAIVFGLSMDYEVFLLSSIRERYDATGDNGAAVADGLAATARVITAAAAIMVFVFGSFVFGDLRSIKLIGLGLAAAVLIDATIVRMVLVPATMELLGDRNWWLPRWLDRRLPHLEVERRPPSVPLAPAPVREGVGR